MVSGFFHEQVCLTLDWPWLLVAPSTPIYNTIMSAAIPPFHPLSLMYTLHNSFDPSLQLNS